MKFIRFIMVLFWLVATATVAVAQGFTFPSNPTTGQQIVGPNGAMWEWDGTKWVQTALLSKNNPVFTNTLSGTTAGVNFIRLDNALLNAAAPWNGLLSLVSTRATVTTPRPEAALLNMTANGNWETDVNLYNSGTGVNAITTFYMQGDASKNAQLSVVNTGYNGTGPWSPNSVVLRAANATNGLNLVAEPITAPINFWTMGNRIAQIGQYGMGIDITAGRYLQLGAGVGAPTALDATVRISGRSDRNGRYGDNIVNGTNGANAVIEYSLQHVGNANSGWAGFGLTAPGFVGNLTNNSFPPIFGGTEAYIIGYGGLLHLDADHPLLGRVNSRIVFSNDKTISAQLGPAGIVPNGVLNIMQPYSNCSESIRFGRIGSLAACDDWFGLSTNVYSYGPDDTQRKIAAGNTSYTQFMGSGGWWGWMAGTSNAAANAAVPAGTIVFEIWAGYHGPSGHSAPLGRAPDISHLMDEAPGIRVTNIANEEQSPPPQITNGELMRGSRDSFGAVHADAWPITMVFATPENGEPSCTANSARGVPGIMYTNNQHSGQAGTQIDFWCEKPSGGSCDALWFSYHCTGTGNT